MGKELVIQLQISSQMFFFFFMSNSCLKWVLMVIVNLITFFVQLNFDSESWRKDLFQNKKRNIVDTSSVFLKKKIIISEKQNIFLVVIDILCCLFTDDIWLLDYLKINRFSFYCFIFNCMDSNQNFTFNKKG